MSERPLNIVLLMTDEHRADHVSFLPGSRVQTPNMDRLAGSVGFGQCITSNPICTPARCALLTGRYTRQIQMLDMSGDLDWRHPTYLRALQRQGYHTSAVGKLHWWQGWRWGTPTGRGHDLVAAEEEICRYGLDSVWEVSGKQLAVRNDCRYIEHLRAKGLDGQYREFVERCGPNNDDLIRNVQDLNPWPFAEEDYIDVVTADRIIEAIRRRPTDRPFILFGSFCSPHQPFDPPARYIEQVPEQDLGDVIPGAEPLGEATAQRLRRLKRGYKAMIRLVDDQVGRILEVMAAEGLMDNTVILFTADHGEMLGDHGRVQKSTWHDGSARIPCAIRHPRHLDGRVVNTPVELTDLTATILDVAGLEPGAALSMDWPSYNDRVPCRSLMPIVRGEADRVRDFAYSECRDRWQMLRCDDFTYVRQRTGAGPGEVREMLFDRRRDPAERVDEVANPECAQTLAWYRQQREWISDYYVPVQHRWAPSRDGGRL